MKRKIFIPTALGIFFMSLISCKKEQILTEKSEDNLTDTASVEHLAIDTATSAIEWKGFKVFKIDNMSHFGTLKFLEGEIEFKDNKVKGGIFSANMKTLKNTDLITDEEGKAQLEAHLKSDDFFAVEKFSTATYEITKLTPTEDGDYNTILEGKMTIKGITKPVSLKANIIIDESSVSIYSEPTEINRKDFGVSFQSPAKDQIIKDVMEIQIAIKAPKK